MRKSRVASEEEHGASPPRHTDSLRTTTYVYRPWISLLPHVLAAVVFCTIIYACITLWNWNHQASKSEDTQPYTNGVLYDIGYEIGRGWQAGVNDGQDK